MNKKTLYEILVAGSKFLVIEYSKSDAVKRVREIKRLRNQKFTIRALS